MWDLSNVTGMFAMFMGASVFNQDVSSRDVSRVIRMKELFGDGMMTSRVIVSCWEYVDDESSITNYVV
jgi:hypothetical protein